jgi:hypothetical protein
MIASASFYEFLREQFAALGHVTTRCRFGKTGVFCDGPMSVGRHGMLALAFGREAASAEAAVKSAIKHVHRAIPGAKLVAIAPDFF